MDDLERKAREVHREAVVVDTLSYRCDGYDPALAEGGVDAVHITVCTMYAGFREAMESIGKTLRRLESDERWTLATDVSDVMSAKERGVTSIILGFQNAKPLEDNLDNLLLFYRLGVRVIQLTYNERNFVGDGCLEPSDAGLSRFGKDLVRAMNELGVLIDLSHVGYRTTMEAIEYSEVPVAVTHSNPKALAPNPRNKADDQIKALAAKGGVIGVSPYGPICWDPRKDRPPTLDDVVAHVDYVAELVGIDHVAVGTDFPVGVPRHIIDHYIQYIADNYPGMSAEYNKRVGGTFEDRYPKEFSNHSQFPNLTAALLRRGYSAEDVKKVLGGNFLRVAQQVWSR